MTTSILDKIPKADNLIFPVVAMFAIGTPSTVYLLWFYGWLETLINVLAIGLIGVLGAITAVCGLSSIALFFVVSGWLSHKSEQRYHEQEVMALERKRMAVEVENLAIDGQVKLSAASGAVALNNANVTQILTRLEQQNAAIMAFASGQAGQVQAADIKIERPKREALPEPQDDTTEATQGDLRAVWSEPNLLVIGGKGTGKTTLLQHIEAQRIQAGHRIIILDSHSQPGKWLGSVTGAARDYQLIKMAMIAIVQLMHERYEAFSSGQSHFESVTVFIDEFTLLPDKVASLGYDITEFSKPVLTEGRKVGLNLILAGHSDRVASLGLKGAGDLVECFDAKLHLKNVKGERFALVDFGEGIAQERYTYQPSLMPAMLQGDFVEQPPEAGPEPGIFPQLEAMSEFDSQVFEAWHSGARTLTAIREYMGKGKNGQINRQIRDSLELLGLELGAK